MEIVKTRSRIGSHSVLVALLASTFWGCAQGGGDRPARAGRGEQASAPTSDAGVSAAARAPGSVVQDTLPSGSPGQRYIVTITQPSTSTAEGIRRTAERAVAPSDGEVVHIYTTALRGFAAVLTPEAASELQESGRFSVEPDRWMRKSAETQPNPPSWGLDRLDGALDAAYRFDGSGAGVNVYILDSGIRLSHQEFGNRASTFADLVGGDGTDPDGHGTHVAGTVAGTTFGVAKQVRVHSVRVLNAAGEGRWSDLIQAIDSVIIAGRRPAVINMSLGGPAYAKADTAVQRAVRAGITVVVAAGNEADDACDSSPAREPMAITVGATTQTDAMPNFSNSGSCVDILAPGESIVSAGRDTDDGAATLSGTSMASPHVAGAAALFLQTRTAASPAQVVAALLARAARDRIQNVRPGTPNLLLQTGP